MSGYSFRLGLNPRISSQGVVPPKGGRGGIASLAAVPSAVRLRDLFMSLSRRDRPAVRIRNAFAASRHASAGADGEGFDLNKPVVYSYL